MFSIDIYNTKPCAEEISEVADILRRVDIEITEIKSAMAALKGMEEIVGAVDAIHGQVSVLSKHMTDLYDALERIVWEYERDEDYVIDNAEGIYNITPINIGSIEVPKRWQSTKEIDEGIEDWLNTMLA